MRNQDVRRDPSLKSIGLEGHQEMVTFKAATQQACPWLEAEGRDDLGELSLKPIGPHMVGRVFGRAAGEAGVPSQERSPFIPRDLNKISVADMAKI